MLEDRLKSFLYYCGYFPNRNSLSLSKKTKSFILEFAEKYGDGKGIKGFDKISTKMMFIEYMLKWYEESEKDNDDLVYFNELRKCLSYIDMKLLKNDFSSLKVWLDYRNEVMHASMNKNIDSLYDGLLEWVETGMEIARDIDSQVKILKRKSNVRKIMKLQNN